jgi:hypothetical protein
MYRYVAPVVRAFITSSIPLLLNRLFPHFEKARVEEHATASDLTLDVAYSMTEKGSFLLYVSLMNVLKALIIYFNYLTLNYIRFTLDLFFIRLLTRGWLVASL